MPPEGERFHSSDIRHRMLATEKQIPMQVHPFVNGLRADMFVREGRDLGAVACVFDRYCADVPTVGADRGDGQEMFAKDRVFERVSVGRDHVVLAEAPRHGRGEISHDELKGVLASRELF
jgi:hypothetical protein